MQMSLVTEKFARKFPVGYAQDAPNEDPFLPRVNVSCLHNKMTMFLKV